MIRADVADEEKRLTIIDPKLANIILAVLVIEKINAEAAYICVQSDDHCWYRLHSGAALC